MRFRQASLELFPSQFVGRYFGESPVTEGLGGLTLGRVFLIPVMNRRGAFKESNESRSKSLLRIKDIGFVVANPIARTELNCYDIASICTCKELPG